MWFSATSAAWPSGAAGAWLCCVRASAWGLCSLCWSCTGPAACAVLNKRPFFALFCCVAQRSLVCLLTEHLSESPANEVLEICLCIIINSVWQTRLNISWIAFSFCELPQGPGWSLCELPVHVVNCLLMLLIACWCRELSVHFSESHVCFVNCL